MRLTDPLRWRSGSGFRMTRSPLDPGDGVTRGPLRVTSAARTLVDCAREWDLEAAVVALDAGLLAERTTPQRLRLVGAGCAPADLQVEIRSGRRLVAVVDAWYEEAAVAVEFDGRVTYTEPWRTPGRLLWDEKRREDELRALDIRVVRGADADLRGGWFPVEARLRRLVTTPGPAVRRFTATPSTHGVPRSA